MYTVDLSAKFKQWVQSRAEATATMKTESTTSKERASVILDIQNTVISQIGLWGAYQEHTKELRDKEKTERKRGYGWCSRDEEKFKKPSIEYQVVANLPPK